MRKLLSLSAIVLAMAVTPFAYQKPEPDAKKKKLTEEEKDIIKNREILENLDLLQNFDKFRYFDLFAGQDLKKDKGPAKRATKKDERKEK